MYETRVGETLSMRNIIARHGVVSWHLMTPPEFTDVSVEDICPDHYEDGHCMIYSDYDHPALVRVTTSSQSFIAIVEGYLEGGHCKIARLTITTISKNRD